MENVGQIGEKIGRIKNPTTHIHCKKMCMQLFIIIGSIDEHVLIRWNTVTHPHKLCPNYFEPLFDQKHEWRSETKATECYNRAAVGFCLRGFTIWGKILYGLFFSLKRYIAFPTRKAILMSIRDLIRLVWMGPGERLRHKLLMLGYFWQPILLWVYNEYMF